ncbi:glycoside hydrolase family 93 protein [Annulohypoxylon maeteangense]|uniref:glycoside hydrolase family 93 protein n=1 Tax=Annulohypoxylon maeteangense TaxID=1927788 RepID=UPI0020075282|nr:glycoside hydrolase family 93 protein [Annulohypoxylon maeteangense]KAI0884204.1 glycoside hydrolase family 93 protein [Annulohypoxylon maeteangense]
MSQRSPNMSLIFMLLSYLSIVSFVSASPIPIKRDDLSARDTTTTFNEIGASFTLGSSENRVNSAGTYPRLARLSDGGILSISTVRSGNTRTLVVSRSDDNGATFSEIGSVAQSTGDLDNGFLLQLSSGTILAAFRNHDLDANGAATYYRITVCSSTDGGRTWAFLSQAAENAANGFNGLWEPFIRVANSGTIQLTYSGELSATNQETFRVTSTNGGATWTAPTNLQLHGSQQLRDGMQGIAATTDAATGQAALVMVFEINDNTHVYLGTVTSYDDGNTWGSRSTIFRPADHNAGAPQIATIGENLAVVFMTDEDRAVSEIAWPANADVKMIFSTELRNGQVTWTTQTLELSVDSSYWPGAFQRDGDGVIAVYERGGVPYGRVISAA